MTENSIRKSAVAANGVQAPAGCCSPRAEANVCTPYGLSDLAEAIFGNRNGNKERKRVLREMKKLVAVVRGHARRYRTLLDENWQATDWTRRQAEQVLKRIDSVMEALPAAVK